MPADTIAEKHSVPEMIFQMFCSTEIKNTSKSASKVGIAAVAVAV